MPKFEDLMNMLKTQSAESPLPDDFADQLEKAYKDDLSIRDAAVDARQKLLAERDSEVTKLKAHNYDLLRQIPQDAGTKKTSQPKGVDNSESEEDNEYTGTIEDLLSKNKLEG